MAEFAPEVVRLFSRGNLQRHFCHQKLSHNIVLAASAGNLQPFSLKR
jgi:hypothetical protein